MPLQDGISVKLFLLKRQKLLTTFEGCFATSTVESKSKRSTTCFLYEIVLQVHTFMQDIQGEIFFSVNIGTHTRITDTLNNNSASSHLQVKQKLFCCISTWDFTSHCCSALADANMQGSLWGVNINQTGNADNNTRVCGRGVSQLPLCLLLSKSSSAVSSDRLKFLGRSRGAWLCSML